MSIIANLVARFTADTSGFEAGTKRAGQSMKGMMSTSLALQKAAAGLTAAYIGGRALVGAIRSVTDAAMAQESAERKLVAALALTGDATGSNVSWIKEYATALQKQTIYSDKEILNQIALAKNMGLSTTEIERATVAAIGLAAKYDKDLGQAMKLITLAAKGETGQLKEMGIVVGKNLSSQEKYNELIRQGVAGFALAKSATQDTTGAMDQLNNSWGDLKENLAENVLPLVNDFVKGLNRIVEAGNAVSDFISDLGKGMPDALRQAAIIEYQQTTGDVNAFRRVTQPTGGEAMTPPQYTKKWQAILAQYQNQLQQDQSIPHSLTGSGLGGDGAAALSETTQAARDQVLKLNAALDDQITRQLAVANGERNVSEQIQFNRALMEGYADEDLPAAIRMMGEYAAKLDELDAMKSRAAAGDLIESMEEENEYLSLLREGREEEAEALRVVNGLRREGIDLLPEETQRIEELIEANEKLQKGYGNDIGVGISGAVSAMQDDLGGLGDLSFDVVTEGIDGMADAMTNAIFEAEDLGQAMEDLAVDIAKMVAQWAIKQAITSALGGIGFGPANAKGNVFGPSGLVPFARGGVVDRPTLFPFARGTGLMGEAGPEGILPLKRTAAGELGVRAELGSSGSGQVEALLGRIVTLLGRRQQVTLNATIADGRDVVTRRQMESREGERMVMYHVGRNQ